MPRYLLDANIFIQAKNLHYGFDFCPAFWNWLQRQNDAGVVGSIERVWTELVAGNDTLSDWANERGDAFFHAPDDAVLPALARVSEWVLDQAYDQAAVATFFQVADYWLVAHALAHGCTVVTNERPADSIRKIKIPNPCVGLGITCMSPYEMLRRERARFVLGPHG